MKLSDSPCRSADFFKKLCWSWQCVMARTCTKLQWELANVESCQRNWLANDKTRIPRRGRCGSLEDSGSLDK
ncbi:uncharacterized protein PgNI_09661 [Pyricularia grisea]|uniref:Uncharacterized protein n=1 Tax=Pyricularia grisea TaxID=148305 RepID=A0A6P8ARQ0_PYRGI|nr:uncharacterized protein PgNI_09661 [Pyricularia grisea]TLD04788.1 hypothetical protein PgNI_09661 [Pyricularia grisea]